MSQPPPATMPSIPDQSKKKTRRRLRVSCVECTRRRQKCDREQPCGLCKARGVEHMCRWELEPFARPVPARPPTAVPPTSARPSPAGDQPRDIQPDAPQMRPLTTTVLPPDAPAAQNQAHPRRSQPFSPVDQEVKEAAIALAQLSVARRGEYLSKGSLVCALYQLGGPDVSKVPFERSTELPPVMKNVYPTNLTNSFSSVLQELVASLPHKETCDTLFANFFDRENWRFALPHDVLLGTYDGMWAALRAGAQGAPDGISVHWLTLLYAVFALAPVVTSCADEPAAAKAAAEQARRAYFLHALSGRRLAEDMLCVSFSAALAPPPIAQGTAYGCLAVVLLAHYMCDRGNASEAWKMVGAAVRTAQTVGLHRDPEWYKWKDMGRDEQALRRTTWWLLAIHDRLLSFVLGRPTIIRACDTDVPLPKIPSSRLAHDGKSDTNAIYHAFMARLSGILGECREKCFGLEPSPYASSVNMDTKFETWEKELPAYLSCRSPDTSFDPQYPHLPMQRWRLAVYYFTCRMILHRPFIHSQPPILPAPHGSAMQIETNPSRTKCIAMALELIRVQHTIHVHVRTGCNEQPMFAHTLLVFDGAITLCIALLQEPQNVRAREWRAEIDAAVALLEHARAADAGDIVRQALVVLGVLHRACVARGAPPSEAAGAQPWPPGAARPTSPFAAAGHAPLAPELPLNFMADGLASGSAVFELLRGLGHSGDWQEVLNSIA